MIRRKYKTFGFCCGLGGGAKGFKKAASRVGNMVATWRCQGGHQRRSGEYRRNLRSGQSDFCSLGANHRRAPQQFNYLLGNGGQLSEEIVALRTLRIKVHGTTCWIIVEEWLKKLQLPLELRQERPCTGNSMRAVIGKRNESGQVTVIKSGKIDPSLIHIREQHLAREIASIQESAPPLEELHGARKHMMSGGNLRRDSRRHEIGVRQCDPSTLSPIAKCDPKSDARRTDRTKSGSDVPEAFAVGWSIRGTRIDPRYRPNSCCGSAHKNQDLQDPTKVKHTRSRFLGGIVT